MLHVALVGRVRIFTAQSFTDCLEGGYRVLWVYELFVKHDGFTSTQAQLYSMIVYQSYKIEFQSCSVLSQYGHLF